MGQAELTSAASTHSLQNVQGSDDLPPPSYEQVTAESSQPPASSGPANTSANNGISLIYADIGIPGGERAVSAGSHVRNTTIVTLRPELSTNPRALYTAFAQQVHLPPRPQLHISGTHTDSTKKKGDKKNGSDVVTDFSFRVDLAETLLKGWNSFDNLDQWHTISVARDYDGVKTFRGTRLKTANSWTQNNEPAGAARSGPIRLSDNEEDVPDLPEDEIDDDDEERRLVQPEEHEQDQWDERFGSRKDQDDFMEWCERFCHDPSPVKS